MTDQPFYTLPTLRCLRCQHQWFPRAVKQPDHCPKCNSPYWNRPRIIRKRKALSDRALGKRYTFESMEGLIDFLHSPDDKEVKE